MNNIIFRLYFLLHPCCIRCRNIHSCFQWRYLRCFLGLMQPNNKNNCFLWSVCERRKPNTLPHKYAYKSKKNVQMLDIIFRIPRSEAVFLVRLGTSKARGMRDIHYETLSLLVPSSFPARLKIRPLNSLLTLLKNYDLGILDELCQNTFFIWL